MPEIGPIREFVFTDHALSEMARRQITEEDVKMVLSKPEQMEMVREGRLYTSQGWRWAIRQRIIWSVCL